MQKISIIIIKPNNFNILEFSNSQESINNINQYLEIADDINNDNFMQTIIHAISPNLTEETLSQHIGDTTTCLETPSKIYQLCFQSSELNNDANNLASFLTTDNKIIYGPACLISVTNEDEMKLSSVTYNELLLILQKKLNHHAIIIKSDGNFENVLFKNDKFNYSNNNNLTLIETIKKTFDNKRSINVGYISCCGYNLNIYFVNDNDQINKKATTILGKKKIFGDALITLKITNDLHGDIDTGELSKIIDICHGSMTDRNNLNSEIDEDNPELNNRFLLMNKIYNKRTSDSEGVKSCNKCKNNNDLKYCTGCYRIFYCSQECQTIDWKTHSNDCIPK
jgi:hypothetical protein